MHQASSPVGGIQPIHDQFCRCRDCKPPLTTNHDLRARVWVALAMLLAMFWTVVAMALFV